MSREEDRVPDLKDIEAALASLAPRGDRIDRDRLMFLAGQASVGGRTGDVPTTSVGMAPGVAPRVAPRGRWAWPASLAAVSALAATLLVMLVVRPGPQVVERIVEVPVPGEASGKGHSLPRNIDRSVPGALSPALASYPTSPDSYHKVLERVLQHGLDAWKPPAGDGATATAAAPVTYRELLETMLQEPARSGAG